MAWSNEDLMMSVERLAAPGDSQVAWLRRLGTYPMLDELALDFEYEFGRLRGSEGALVEALAVLDGQVSSMSGPPNESLWLPNALDGEEWKRVRELARRALRAAGLPASRPEDLWSIQRHQRPNA